MSCLILVCNIWPSSVLPSSGIGKFDFRHVLPNSGMGKMHVLPKSVLPSSGAPQRRRSRGRKEEEDGKLVSFVAIEGLSF